MGAAAHWSDCYAYAACSGVAGSMSVLFSGVVAKLVVRTFRGANQFHSPLAKPFPYVVTLLVAASIFLQVHLLNMGLQLGDIMGVFPVFMAFWIVFSVVGGIVYYHTEHTNPLLLVGVACMVAGVVLFQQHDREKARCDKMMAERAELAPFGADELDVDEAAKQSAASRRRK